MISSLCPTMEYFLSLIFLKCKSPALTGSIRKYLEMGFEFFLHVFTVPCCETPVTLPGCLDVSCEHSWSLSLLHGNFLSLPGCPWLLFLSLSPPHPPPHNPFSALRLLWNIDGVFSFSPRHLVYSHGFCCYRLLLSPQLHRPSYPLFRGKMCSMVLRGTMGSHGNTTHCSQVWWHTPVIYPSTRQVEAGDSGVQGQT